MIEPIRLIAFASLVLLTMPHAAASGACTEQSLQKSLKQIEGNLAKPSVQGQIAKARADFAPDQDFDDIDAVVVRMRARGAELIGEMQYEDTYRLAYIRGPEGIIVALAEQLGS